MFRLRRSRSAGPLACRARIRVSETRSEALDLRLDPLGHVLGRAQRHVAVRPHRVLAGRRAGLVEERGLGEEDVGALTARRAFRLGDLLERAAEMHGRRAPAVGRRPRDRPFQSPVELEDAGAVPIALKRVRVVSGQLVAGDAQELPRDDVGQDGVRVRQLVDRACGADLPTKLLETIGQRVGEPLRPSSGKAPAEDVRGRDQEQPDASARPRLERQHRVRSVAGERARGLGRIGSAWRGRPRSRARPV